MNDLMNAVTDILRGGRDRLLNRKNWTRGTFARRADRKGTYPSDPEAVAWCARGSVQAQVSMFDAQGFRTSGNADTFRAYRLAEQLLDAVAQEEFGVDSIVRLNDEPYGRGYPKVMRVLELAIKRSEED